MSLAQHLRISTTLAAADSVFRPIELPNGCTVHIKLESYRTDASIKEKPAVEMLAQGLENDQINPRVGVIETSSGNTARALARLGAIAGIPVTLVVDPNVSATNVAVMQAFGAKVIKVHQRDRSGGFQKTRIARVQAECACEPQLFWINQYDNPGNAAAHLKTTGPEIQSVFPNVGRVYCAVGTGGTATGLGRYFAARGSRTQIVGCDAVGSVTFGGPPGPRHISGPGNSFAPGNWDPSCVHATQYVPEAEAIAMCHWLASQHGLLLGGSTGLALAGALRHLEQTGNEVVGQIVVISPDSGEKYLDQIWKAAWVNERFQPSVIDAAHRRLGLE